MDNPTRPGVVSANTPLELSSNTQVSPPHIADASERRTPPQRNGESIATFLLAQLALRDAELSSVRAAVEATCSRSQITAMGLIKLASVGNTKIWNLTSPLIGQSERAQRIERIENVIAEVMRGKQLCNEGSVALYSKRIVLNYQITNIYESSRSLSPLSEVWIELRSVQLVLRSERAQDVVAVIYNSVGGLGQKCVAIQCPTLELAKDFAGGLKEACASIWKTQSPKLQPRSARHSTPVPASNVSNGSPRAPRRSDLQLNVPGSSSGGSSLRIPASPKVDRLDKAGSPSPSKRTRASQASPGANRRAQVSTPERVRKSTEPSISQKSSAPAVRSIRTMSPQGNSVVWADSARDSADTSKSAISEQIAKGSESPGTLARKRPSFTSYKKSRGPAVRSDSVSSVAFVTKRSAQFGRSSGCIVRADYLGEIGITRFHKVAGNQAQMQAKLNAAIKQLHRRLGPTGAAGQEMHIAMCMGTVIIPSIPDSKTCHEAGRDLSNVTPLHREPISTTHIRYLALGNQLPGERATFAFIHGSVSSEAVDTTVFACPTEKDATACTYAMSRALTGAAAMMTTPPPSRRTISSTPPSTGTDSTETASKKRKRGEVDYYGTLEIAGGTRYKGRDFASQATRAFVEAVEPVRASINVSKNEVRFTSVTESHKHTTVPMVAITSAVASGTNLALFSYHCVDGAWRQFVHVVDAGTAPDAVKHRDSVVASIETAVLDQLSHVLSSSNVALWNVLSNIRELAPPMRLERVLDILASLPDDNVVEPAFAQIRMFCRNEGIESAALMRLLHHAGVLNKTDSLGFSIPVSSGDIFDEAQEELSKVQSQLRAKWDELEPVLVGFPDNKKIDVYDRTFRRTSLPANARGQIWFECIGKRRKLLSPKSYAQYLRESKLIGAEEKVQILKDVPRTFGHTNYQFSPTNQRNLLPQLENLLMAKCAKNPGTYWQGMSFIAGFILLQYSDEETAYWTLVGMLDDVMPLLFTNLGPTVENQLFGEILAEKLPLLAAHIVTLDVPAEILCTEWFMCAFSTSLPCDSVLHMWDKFILATASQHHQRVRDQLHDDCRDDELSSGIDLMHLFGVQLLGLYQDDLLRCPDIAELSEVLKSKLQATWKLPSLDPGEMMESTESSQRRGSVEAYDGWTRYVSAKRFRLQKELDFSSRRMEKLRTLEAVYNAHTGESETLSMQDFAAICLDLAGDMDDNDHTLLQIAKEAFGSVVEDKSHTSIDYDQFLIACTNVPKINQMMQVADLSGNSALERLRSLFLQHADEFGELSREQLFGLVRTIYTVSGEAEGGRVGSPNSRKSSQSLEDYFTDPIGSSTSDPAPKFRKRSLSEGAPPSLYDLCASSTSNDTPDAQVSKLRRSRTISDRLFNLIDRDNQGKISFDDFVRYGRHTSIFNLALSLLGSKSSNAKSGMSIGALNSRGSFTSVQSIQLASPPCKSTKKPDLDALNFAVGNPLFFGNAESESFSAKIVGSERIKLKRRLGKRKQGRIEFEISVKSEFSEERKVRRTFVDFSRLYGELFDMTKDDGRLPVEDVSTLLNVPFPKSELMVTCSEAALVEHVALLQGFLDAAHMMRSPEVAQKISDFCISAQPENEIQQELVDTVAEDDEELDDETYDV